MADNESANQNLLAGMDPRDAEKQRQAKAKTDYATWAKWCEENEVKLEKAVEDLVPGQLIRAAANVLEKKRRAWENALANRNEAIRYAIEHHEHLADNYWQEEYKAYEVLLATRRVYATILKITMENDNGK